MGNFYSSNSKKTAQDKFDNFYEVIDFISTYYILTMDFKSLSKLSEKEYCNKLVVLTSDIIDRYFNESEITFLSQRIKEGVEVNDLKNEKVIYINKDNLDSLDISNDTQKSIKKKRVCIGIAKFYIKIAHIFAAIVMTINPVYTYNGPNGETIQTGLLEKDKIPKNVQRKLYKLNICDNRIRSLKKGELFDSTNNTVSLQPRICSMNIDKKTKEVKNLDNEPGIPELMRLYLDDNYDYSNGKFTGMSNETKKQFLKDLNTFYTAFTGNKNMPTEITKFSDIKLRDYRSKQGCQNDSPLLKTKITLSTKDKLFVKYAENINRMIQTAANNQSKLLSVINELFTYVIDPYTGKKVIRVNPKLNEELLQKSVEKTRRLIVDLYVKCENDYTEGLQIYEAIVESQIAQTTEKQIEKLEKKKNSMIQDAKKMLSPIPISKSIASPYSDPAFIINNPSPDNSFVSSDNTSTEEPNIITPSVASESEFIESNTSSSNNNSDSLSSSDETIIPSSMETVIPSSMETNPPSSMETNPPSSMETVIPSSMETNIPSSMETNIPSSMETNIPSSIETDKNYINKN